MRPLRRWDFGSYKLHPLGDRDDDLVIRAGSHLYRGSTTRYFCGRGLESVDPKARRLYMSEADEDAAGYGYIHRDPKEGVSSRPGGRPVLVVIEVDGQLLARLEPGLEAPGEWFIRTGLLPWRHIAKVLRLPRSEDRWGQAGFVTLDLPDIRGRLIEAVERQVAPTRPKPKPGSC